MRLGFYGNYTKETAEFAQRVGFRSMELAAWPKSTVHAYIGEKELTEIREDLEKKDIEISALGFYPNYLSPDRQEREEAQAYFIKLLDLAQRMDVHTVATFVGRNWEKSVEDNIPEYKEVFGRFCEEAAKRNVRIAIENCPMLEYRKMRSKNIAYSPEIWEVMFNEVPAENLGLEIDPAHMVWLGIDYDAAIHEFGHKIFHAHAKDSEVRKGVLSRVGILGQQFNGPEHFGHGWWRARTPGWGDVDWHKYVSALIDVGYTGNIDIEHEDGVFFYSSSLGSVALNEESDLVNNASNEEIGLMMGYNTLKDIIPS